MPIYWPVWETVKIGCFLRIRFYNLKKKQNKILGQISPLEFDGSKVVYNLARNLNAYYKQKEFARL